MTDNQQIFCDEYLKDRNATRAYKAAYKRVKKDAVAATNGGRMLRNAEVQKYIQEKLEALSSASIASVEECLIFHTHVMRGELKDTVINPVTGMQEEIAPNLGTRQKSANALMKQLDTLEDKKPKQEYQQLLNEKLRMELENAREMQDGDDGIIWNDDMYGGDDDGETEAEAEG